jgi:hypothetical protein
LVEAFTGGLEVVLKFVLRDESVFSCDLNHFGRKRVFSFEKSKKEKKISSNVKKLLGGGLKR